MCVVHENTVHFPYFSYVARQQFSIVHPLSLARSFMFCFYYFSKWLLFLFCFIWPPARQPETKHFFPGLLKDLIHNIKLQYIPFLLLRLLADISVVGLVEKKGPPSPTLPLYIYRCSVRKHNVQRFTATKN